MAPIQVESSRQEHASLCEELTVLKEAEGSSTPQLWKTLRDVCERLTTGLREHMQREGSQLLDHHSDYRYLQVITRYIAKEDRPFLLNNRYQMLSNFIRGMHGHMQEQEAIWNV